MTPSRLVALAALVLTTLLLLATDPDNTGDALDYGRDVAGAQGALAPALLEPGHLLWRPLGVVLRDVTGGPADGSPHAVREAQRLLGRVAMVATVAAAILVGLTALRLFGTVRAGVAAATLTAAAAVMLGYGQAGCAYVPGFAFAALALWLATRGGRGAGIGAGAALAAATLLWLPFVLVVPMGLLAVFLLGPGERGARLRDAAWATATCAVIGLVAYAAAAAANGVHAPADFVAWISGSSHGISRPGFSRVVIGFPRSFVHMGVDGREVRRFLAHDPLNPVGTRDLLRLWLWPKMLAFYGALALAAWHALRSPRGRALLGLFAAGLVPVVLLAAAWSGGEEERYLALLGLVVLLLVLLVEEAWRGGRLAAVATAAVALAWGSNLSAFGPGATRARAEAVAARLGCLEPAIDARTLFLLPAQSDPVITFFRDRLDDVPRSRDARLVRLIPPTEIPGLGWEATLDSVLALARARGERVLVPAYVLDSVPPRWAGWVEGMQYGVAWREVRARFAALAPAAACEPAAFLEVARP